MTKEIRAEYDQILENLSDKLDIPPRKYQKAVQRYREVGNWLKDGNCDGSEGNTPISLQGSFRLGTVVRPIRKGEESDYDIDMVCRLLMEKRSTIPEKIKTIVGDRLKDNDVYKRMLDHEGRRCWTLNYAEEDGVGFHLDVLPSTAEDPTTVLTITSSGVASDMARQAIAITEKKGSGEFSWNTSNPSGYAEWFDKVKMPIFEKIQMSQRRLLFQSNQDIFSKIDDVPDPLVKTPLQRSIQILKRHRDLRFVGHEWETDKPISIILTTLAANLYQQQEDVYSTLRDFIEQLDEQARLLQPGFLANKNLPDMQFMKKKADGTWYIPNPVNPAENFADRWHENDHRKARAFFQWVSWVRTDLVELLNQGDISKIVKSLQQSFGERIIVESAKGIYVSGAPAIVVGHTGQTPRIQISNPSKPWGGDY